MRYATHGRPRALTQAQLEALLDWHRHRKTLRDWARELRVSVTTLQNALRSGGRHYKQAPPEQRAIALAEARARRRALRARGYG